MCAFASIVGTLTLDLFAAVVVIVATAGGTRLLQLLPSRRLWRITDPSRLVIVAAQSTTSETGKYVRPATGLGQLRALATITPSLSRAYGSLTDTSIVLSDALSGSFHEVDIVSLGGSKNNHVTSDILASLREQGVPVPHSGTSMLAWPGVLEGEYEAETRDGHVMRDYGMIVRARSPYNPRRIVVVLAGASTFGTAAAARYFVERCALVRGDFAAMVCADVRNAHVLPPVLIRQMALPAGVAGR